MQSDLDAVDFVAPQSLPEPGAESEGKLKSLADTKPNSVLIEGQCLAIEQIIETTLLVRKRAGIALLRDGAGLEAPYPHGRQMQR